MRSARWWQRLAEGTPYKSLVNQSLLGARQLSSNSPPGWQHLPPAAFLPDSPAPSALSWLRRRLSGVPDSLLHRLFRERSIKLLGPAGDHTSVKPDSTLTAGAVIAVPAWVQAEGHQSIGSTGRTLPAGNRSDSREEEVAEKLKSAILHEDDDVLILNKPAGMPVQGGGRNSVSLDQVLKRHFVWRGQFPRLVHRLDADTSGAIVLARTPDSAAWLSAAFARPAKASDQQQPSGPVSIQKWYQAVVVGLEHVPSTCTVKDPVPSKAGVLSPARTNVTVRKRAPGLAWLDCQLVTGRKHQLRLHCANSLGMPVLGDSKYGHQRRLMVELLAHLEHDAIARDLRSLLRKERLYLHSSRLCISAGQSRPVVAVEAPLPAHMQRLDELVTWEPA